MGTMGEGQPEGTPQGYDRCHPQTTIQPQTQGWQQPPTDAPDMGSCQPVPHDFWYWFMATVLRWKGKGWILRPGDPKRDRMVRTLGIVLFWVELVVIVTIVIAAILS